MVIIRLVKHWKRVPGEAAEPTSLGVFKSMQDLHLAETVLLKLQMTSQNPLHFTSLKGQSTLVKLQLCLDAGVAQCSSNPQPSPLTVSQAQQCALAGAPSQAESQSLLQALLHLNRGFNMLLDWGLNWQLFICCAAVLLLKFYCLLLPPVAACSAWTCF